jgi:predicted MPP superfamily phosphohydrolase
MEVSTVDLPVRGLPLKFDGLVACQVSDFHVDSEADLHRLERALARINEHNPDLVFLTGDYFSGPRSTGRYIGAVRYALAKLKPTLGVFAVAGNHDHSSSFWTIARELGKSDVRILTNENYSLEVHGCRVFIVGVDDLWSRCAQPSRAFRGIEPDDCTILLAHNPDTAPYVYHFKPGVMLSGHTHGGLLRIPFYGSLVRSFLQIGSQFYSGLNRYKDFYIYTNRGLAPFPLGFRINCPAEISVFKLTSLRTYGIGKCASR